jgi:ferredoxin
VRLRVDPVACDAYGYCAELFPERIWLDEWGYPVIDPGPVPATQLAAAQAAVRACPRRALQLIPTPSPSDPKPRSAATAPAPRRARLRHSPVRVPVVAAARVALGRRRGVPAQPSATTG